MPVNINTFKNFVEFCSNKIQNGNTITTTQFNLISNQAQLVLFEKDYQTFLATGNISDFLKSFLKNKILNISNVGVAAIPTDLQHVASIRHYYVGKKGGFETEVKEVKNESWGVIQASQLMVATRRFPKYQEQGTKFLFLPRTIGTATLDYFKTPVQPVWGFTVVNNRPVYSSAASTDFEFSEFSLNNVAAVYLSLIGVNLQAGALEQFAQQFKAETTSQF